MGEKKSTKDGTLGNKMSPWLAIIMGAKYRQRVMVLAVVLVALMSYGVTLTMRTQLPSEGFIVVLEGQPSRDAFKILKAKFSDRFKYALTYDYLYDRERLRMVKGAIGWQQSIVLLEGRLDFSRPEYVVLTEAKALRTFGRTNCIGQPVMILGKMRQVVGVIKGNSAEAGSLVPLVKLGNGLRYIGSLPTKFVLGNISSGKGVEATGIDTPETGVQALEMGSAAMMPEESQIDVWLGYDDTLLIQRPWITSLWGRFDDGSNQLQRLANALSLKNVKVRSMSANSSKTEVFWHGGQVILVMTAIYLCLQGLLHLTQIIVKEYKIYALSRYTYQFKWQKNEK